MTTWDFIIALFYHIDQQMGRVPAACGYYFETSPMPPE